MARIEVSNEMVLFRDAIQHAWNKYFAGSDFSRFLELQEAFGKVEEGLFQAIVLWPHGVCDRSGQYRMGALNWLEIAFVEGISSGHAHFGTIKGDGNTYWEAEVEVKANEMPTCHFMEFFDWNPVGEVDYRMVRADVFKKNIQDSRDQRFKSALLRISECSFFLTV